MAGWLFLIIGCFIGFINLGWGGTFHDAKPSNSFAVNIWIVEVWE